jgi:hypothetical protein
MQMPARPHKIRVVPDRDLKGKEVWRLRLEREDRNLDVVLPGTFARPSEAEKFAKEVQGVTGGTIA